MNLVNIMNFIRAKEPRDLETEKKLLKTAELEIQLVKKYGFENTFLLQYDALTESDFAELFLREKDEKMELGLWLEIVKPLTDKVGLPWRGEKDWEWDWHVVPGFSMAYTQEERRLLIDEAMRKFHEIFGFYPKTVASWLIDTFTMEYLSKNYEIDAFAICRDQVNTDAYNLIGGYFNQAYYPSKYNMFCPAQTAENEIHVPVFRLLGSCPVHNYDGRKFLKDDIGGCYTLEPVWHTGQTESCVDWFFKTYWENENMGFSYMQLGQENSFSYENIIPGLSMQLEKLASRDDVTVMKMCDSGRWFKETYPTTPPTSVVAYDDWTGQELQSAYYDCKNYTANLFSREGKLYLRALYLFEETVKEPYLETPCDNWYATYENLPIVDTLIWGKDTDDCGLFIDGGDGRFTCSAKEGSLTASSGNCSISFDEEKIIFENCTLRFRIGDCKARIRLIGNVLHFSYQNSEYAVKVSGNIREVEGGFVLEAADGKIILYIR
ncbi:MAG: hypothetical protein KH828_00565 [Clostridiales bacterium]|nr:hypothetical protein [Clostridiales bacterium]